MFIFKNLILKISSLRFAISLIIFIAISSGIGTFIPQGNNKTFYIDFFDDAPIFGFLNGEKVLKLQLNHIYTSFWFLFALILLCISLAACSFRRQIPSLRSALKWIEFKSEKKFSNLQLTSSHQINEDEDHISKFDLLLKKKRMENIQIQKSYLCKKGINWQNWSFSCTYWINSLTYRFRIWKFYKSIKRTIFTAWRKFGSC